MNTSILNAWAFLLLDSLFNIFMTLFSAYKQNKLSWIFVTFFVWDLFFKIFRRKHSATNDVQDAVQEWINYNIFNKKRWISSDLEEEIWKVEENISKWKITLYSSLRGVNLCWDILLFEQNFLRKWFTPWFFQEYMKNIIVVVDSFWIGLHLTLLLWNYWFFER